MWWIFAGLWAIGCIMGYMVGNRNGIQDGVQVGFWTGRGLESLQREMPFGDAKAELDFRGQHFEWRAKETPGFGSKPNLKLIPGGEEDCE